MSVHSSRKHFNRSKDQTHRKFSKIRHVPVVQSLPIVALGSSSSSRSSTRSYSPAVGLVHLHAVVGAEGLSIIQTGLPHLRIVVRHRTAHLAIVPHVHARMLMLMPIATRVRMVLMVLMIMMVQMVMMAMMVRRSMVDPLVSRGIWVPQIPHLRIYGRRNWLTIPKGKRVPHHCAVFNLYGI